MSSKPTFISQRRSHRRLAALFDNTANLVPSVETHVNHLYLGFDSLGLDPSLLTLGEGRNEDGPIDRELSGSALSLSFHHRSC